MKAITNSTVPPHRHMVVHKQLLHRMGRQEVVLPTDATFLSVQLQQDNIVFWFLTSGDLNQPTEHVIFYICGRGINCSHDHSVSYAGTVQDGPHVWHIFFHHSSDVI